MCTSVLFHQLKFSSKVQKVFTRQSWKAFLTPWAWVYPAAWSCKPSVMIFNPSWVSSFNGTHSSEHFSGHGTHTWQQNSGLTSWNHLTVGDNTFSGGELGSVLWWHHIKGFEWMNNSQWRTYWQLFFVCLFFLIRTPTVFILLFWMWCYWRHKTIINGL